MGNKFCSCENFFNNKNESISLAYQSNKDILEKPNSSLTKTIISVNNEQKKNDSNNYNDVIKENLNNDMKKNGSEKTNTGFNTNETGQKNFYNHNIEKIIYNKEDNNLENEKKSIYENDNVKKYNLNGSEFNNNFIHENIIEEKLEKENNNNINKKENNKNKLTFDDLYDVINSNNKNENNENKNINSNEYQSKQYKNEKESENNEFDSEQLYQNQKENYTFSLGDED